MNERWVLREGKIKGQGRYVGPGSGANLQEMRAKAHVFDFKPASGVFGTVDRPVKLVPKKEKPAPKVEICGADLYVNGQFVAMGDDLNETTVTGVDMIAERLRKALGV